MPTLEEVKVTGYIVGDAPGGDLPAEPADDAPEEAVSLNYAKLEVDYFGSTSSTDSSGGGGGAGKVVVMDISVTASVPKSTQDASFNDHHTGALRNVSGAPSADDSGGMLAGLGDGSVRTIPPATDHGVTEYESGLVYSGESGGMNEAQTGHFTQMVWAETRDATVQTTNLYSWGLDRIDQRDDAAGFFAYDAAFLGGVNVANASDDGYTGGIFVAAGDLDGARPQVFGDFELV
jgi:hypothetical protein